MKKRKTTALSRMASSAQRKATLSFVRGISGVKGKGKKKKEEKYWGI